MDPYGIQMLPPGEQWKQCLDKSVMGLEMCWFGGGDDGSDAADAQLDFQK